MEAKYFSKYPSCVIVEGLNRDAIYDLQRVRYHLIPKTLTHIIKLLEEKDLHEIYNEFSEQASILDEYTSFLRKKDIGLFSDDRPLFRELSPEFEYPNSILSSIIDVDENTSYDIENVRNQLEELGCKYLQLRFYGYNSDKLNEMLRIFADSSLLSIELVYPYTESLSTVEKVYSLKTINSKLTNFIIHSAPLDEATLSESHLGSVIFTPERIEDESCCGCIDSWYFFPNTNLMLMSMNYNNCLWKKISIDRRGNVKNCPSLTQNFGNVSNILLKDVVNDKRFQKYWLINKDDIEGCKDCEMRYMCQDCRAFVVNPDNIFPNRRNAIINFKRMGIRFLNGVVATLMISLACVSCGTSKKVSVPFSADTWTVNEATNYVFNQDTTFVFDTDDLLFGPMSSIIDSQYALSRYKGFDDYFSGILKDVKLDIDSVYIYIPTSQFAVVSYKDNDNDMPPTSYASLGGKDAHSYFNVFDQRLPENDSSLMRRNLYFNGKDKRYVVVDRFHYGDKRIAILTILQTPTDKVQNLTRDIFGENRLSRRMMDYSDRNMAEPLGWDLSKIKTMVSKNYRLGQKLKKLRKK